MRPEKPGTLTRCCNEAAHRPGQPAPAHGAHGDCHARPKKQEGVATTLGAHASSYLQNHPFPRSQQVPNACSTATEHEREPWPDPAAVSVVVRPINPPLGATAAGRPARLVRDQSRQQASALRERRHHQGRWGQRAHARSLHVCLLRRPNPLLFILRARPKGNSRKGHEKTAMHARAMLEPK